MMRDDILNALEEHSKASKYECKELADLTSTAPTLTYVHRIRGRIEPGGLLQATETVGLPRIRRLLSEAELKIGLAGCRVTAGDGIADVFGPRGEKLSRYKGEDAREFREEILRRAKEIRDEKQEERKAVE